MGSAGDDFERRLADSWPPAAWCDVTVLVAVSGGADSVSLLRALLAVREPGPGRLIAAHCNHQLRGEESNGDAAFVAELCRKLGVPCEVGVVEVGNPGDGLEQAAREARYKFLSAAASRCGARYLVTAHTADDQAETILHRILRGTSIAGLAGIPRARQLNELTSLVRPLLGARRGDVLAYLNRLGQNYRVDTSNSQPIFTRNRLRHELLPELAQTYNPAVVDALLRLGQLAQEAHDVLSDSGADLLERSARRTPGGSWEVQRSALAGAPRYLIREMFLQLWRANEWPLQAMGLAEWDALAEMATSGKAKVGRALPGNVEVSVSGDGEQLTLTRTASTARH